MSERERVGGDVHNRPEHVLSQRVKVAREPAEQAVPGGYPSEVRDGHVVVREERRRCVATATIVSGPRDDLSTEDGVAIPQRTLELLMTVRRQMDQAPVAAANSEKAAVERLLAHCERLLAGPMPTSVYLFALD